MDVSEHLAAPDEHLDPLIAAAYDRSVPDRFSPEAIAPTVDLLVDLADDGPAVEFAVGTGRIALPLAATGMKVFGIDFSEPMLVELRRKPGADRLALTVGDMTTTRVCSDASLVYLVFNTIGNLRTQRQQVACFRNAAVQLRPRGAVPRRHVRAIGSARRLGAWDDGRNRAAHRGGALKISGH